MVLAKVVRNFRPPPPANARCASKKRARRWYVVSDGSSYPWRVHVRTGSFAAMGIIQKLSRGLMISGPGGTNRESRRDCAGDQSLGAAGSTACGRRVRKESSARSGLRSFHLRAERGGLPRCGLPFRRDRELGRAPRVGANRASVVVGPNGSLQWLSTCSRKTSFPTRLTRGYLPTGAYLVVLGFVLPDVSALILADLNVGVLYFHCNNRSDGGRRADELMGVGQQVVADRQKCARPRKSSATKFPPGCEFPGG